MEQCKTVVSYKQKSAQDSARTDVPDWWGSARFKQFAWLEVGSVKVALSRLSQWIEPVEISRQLVP